MGCDMRKGRAIAFESLRLDPSPQGEGGSAQLKSDLSDFSTLVSNSGLPEFDGAETGGVDVDETGPPPPAYGWHLPLEGEDHTRALPNAIALLSREEG